MVSLFQGSRLWGIGFWDPRFSSLRFWSPRFWGPGSLSHDFFGPSFWGHVFFILVLGPGSLFLAPYFRFLF